MSNMVEAIVGITAQVILGVAGWHIAKKAGYNPAWGLLAVVPIVSYAAILYFAFNEWPIQKELQKEKLIEPPSQEIQ